jgi:hypothetical protein
VIRCIGDPHNLIRATVGILITTICYMDPAAMVYYIQAIVPMCDSQDENVVEGAIGAMQKVWSLLHQFSSLSLMTRFVRLPYVLSALVPMARTLMCRCAKTRRTYLSTNRSSSSYFTTSSPRSSAYAPR